MRLRAVLRGPGHVGKHASVSYCRATRQPTRPRDAAAVGMAVDARPPPAAQRGPNVRELWASELRLVMDVLNETRLKRRRLPATKTWTRQRLHLCESGAAERVDPSHPGAPGEDSEGSREPEAGREEAARASNPRLRACCFRFFGAAPALRGPSRRPSVCLHRMRQPTEPLPNALSTSKPWSLCGRPERWDRTYEW